MGTSFFPVIGLDLGTTAVKAGLLGGEGTLGDIVSCAAPEVLGVGGRYESDALAYVRVAEQALAQCLTSERGVPRLGMCSQRSTFLVWSRASGEPATPLISWQDNRGAASCEALRGEEDSIRELTGLRLTPYYFAPKLRRLLLERPELRVGLVRGELLAGTLDTYLIWRWTTGRHFITDASMAARTLLMDIRQLRWSPRLCEIFDIPLAILPQIRPSLGMDLRLNNGLTLRASLGDQSAALIASAGVSRSDVLVNLGTGGFALRYLAEGEAALPGYLRTLVYQDSANRAHVAMEGTLNSLAAALAPYPVAGCGIDDLACDDIYCLPEPSGLGAPYFRSDLGLHFSAPVGHLPPRRVGCLLLEGIIFRVVRMLEDFHYASPIGQVLLSGGLSELIALQQGIAQCAPREVYRLKQKDSSLLGAALAASAREVMAHVNAEKVPTVPRRPQLAEKYLRWKQWFDVLLAQQASNH